MEETAVRIPEEQRVAEEEHKGEHKAYLLFAVWFREKHGLERYREYLARASPIANQYGARRVDGLLAIEPIRGQFDPDYISVIEWPSLDCYYEFLKDVQYQAVAPILEEAARKSVILHCRRVH